MVRNSLHKSRSILPLIGCWFTARLPNTKQLGVSNSLLTPMDFFKMRCDNCTVGIQTFSENLVFCSKSFCTPPASHSSITKYIRCNKQEMYNINKLIKSCCWIKCGIFQFSFKPFFFFYFFTFATPQPTPPNAGISNPFYTREGGGIWIFSPTKQLESYASTL